MKKPNEYIRLQGGVVIDPEAVQPSDIRLVNILDGIGGIKRYNGHSTITVLKHSVVLAELFWSDKDKLYALMHDAPEAYVGDVTTAMRSYVGAAWEALYEKFERMIFAKYKVEFSERVREMDKLIVEAEMYFSGLPYPEECTNLTYNEKEYIKSLFNCPRHTGPKAWHDLWLSQVRLLTGMEE